MINAATNPIQLKIIPKTEKTLPTLTWVFIGSYLSANLLFALAEIPNANPINWTVTIITIETIIVGSYGEE